MSRWLKRIAVVAVLAGVVVVLRLTAFAPEPVEVTVYRVDRGRVEETLTNSRAGTVRTRRRAALSPAISGRVVEIGAREGERVREGQVVLRLDDAELRAQSTLQDRAVRAARALVREACARAAQAERDLERSRRLREQGILSADGLEQGESAAEVARASCEAARAELERARAGTDVATVNLDKTILRAPFDGVVAELRTELGEWISPSPPGVAIPPVVDLIDPSSTYVSAPLDEVDVARVEVGQIVRVTLDSHPDRELAGRVVRIAPYVEDRSEQSRTFEVEVELEDEAFARRLKPGMTADVEVLLRAREDVLRVPSYALIEGRRVLVVEGDVLASRPVETGLRNWELVEITGGLSEGESVVVSLDREEVEEGALVVATEQVEP